MSFMMAFGWASIMLCIGMLLRAKIPILRNMLVPASVIAGVLGFVFINAADALGIGIGTDTGMFTNIVNHLFTVSFISITLTSPAKDGGNSTKNMIQGAWGLGVVWSFLFALTPLVGAGLVAIFGKNVSMGSIYGMLIPFAFCQGPGQSATYGALFEQFGWDNASMVAITFSAVGFVSAFLVGVPMAKIGIKRGIAKHCGKIDDSVLKGYLKREEQTEVMVKDTTCNGNIETLAFHFAIIGLCYVLAVGIANILSMIPGFLGTSMGGMMFMNGMYAAYIVKLILKKLKLDFLLENTLQSKITGWTADYLVVCAFMAVSVGIIKAWIVPIAAVCIVTTVITIIVCLYFGQRFGGSNDFERTLGLYGTCTGTIPSGISLVRIVDPNFQTSTAVELGACNLVMLLSTPANIILLALASDSIEMPIALGGLALCCVVYLIILKVFRTWGGPTFSWKGD